MKTLQFYKLSERIPDAGQEIWYIHDSKFYNTYEFRCGKVEYEYYELDQDGQETGTSYYDAPPKQDEEDYNPNFTYKLYCMITYDGRGLSTSMGDDDLWAPVKDIDNALFGES